MLTQPDIIAREIGRMQSSDPTTGDLAAVDRQLTDAARKQGNLSRAVASLDDPDATAPLLAELAALAKQKAALERERETVVARRASWEAAQQRLADLEAQCRRIAQRLGTLDYETRRLALDALGVVVVVYPRDSEHCFVITMAIPFEDQAMFIQGDTSCGSQ